MPKLVKFVITAKMENGDSWETIRHTQSGMESVIQNIFEDESVTGFSVEEIPLV